MTAPSDGVSMIGRLAIAASVALAVAACAPTMTGPRASDSQIAAELALQRELVVRDHYAGLARVIRLGYPLLAANADLCAPSKRVVAHVGFFVASPYDWSPEYRESVRRALGAGDQMRILIVPPGAAARAGVKPNDILLSVNGVVSDGTDASHKAVHAAFTAAFRSRQPLRIEVSRDSKDISLHIDPEPICNFRLLFQGSDDVNAYADGANIVVQGGLLRMLPDDRDLAIVLGHELAHNLMGHIEAGKTNTALGGLVDVLLGLGGIYSGGAFTQIGQRAFSQDFEREADYVGLYLVARANMPVETAPNVWRLMGSRSPAGLQQRYGASHPSPPERSVALQATVEEIRLKRESGQPLFPGQPGSSSGRPGAAPAEAPAR